MPQTLKFDYRDGQVPVAFTPNQVQALVEALHDYQDRTGTKGSASLASAVKKLESNIN